MARSSETTREADAKGPSMSRSQAQIATSYAPGQHFTFEGARGHAKRCRGSRDAPRPNPSVRITAPTGAGGLTRLELVKQPTSQQFGTGRTSPAAGAFFKIPKTRLNFEH